jgi:hypothetical protein
MLEEAVKFGNRLEIRGRLTLFRRGLTLLGEIETSGPARHHLGILGILTILAILIRGALLYAQLGRACQGDRDRAHFNLLL